MAEPAEQTHAAFSSYQWLLRALGAYLDEEPSCRITLLEVSDGFLVRMQRALHKLEPEVHRFDRTSLREALVRLFEEHRPVEHARHQGVWAAFPNGHTDFFRALGYELDQESARNVLIDELDDGVVVTYFRPHNDKWQKRTVFLDQEAIERILNEAFERRGKKPGTDSAESTEAETQAPAEAQA